MRDGEELAYHDRPILLYFANEAAWNENEIVKTR
jgi:hypothetical protein